ncbi:MAG: hypothetical protein QOI98_2478 [Solirubrobacteraceae bacterium]|jgi:hypothetical protein|nr:hypothetical protein [Solirubrobacteraceae bacterium]
MRRTGLAALALGAAVAATSLASPAPDGTASLTPNTPAAPSKFRLDARGEPGGFPEGKIPNSMFLDFQQGFGFDGRSVSVFCTDSEASNYKCPESSRIGKGSVDVVLHGQFLPPNGENYTAAVSFYAAKPRASGDILGVVFQFSEKSSGLQGSTIGRLMPLSDPIYGAEWHFDHLPLPDIPPGITITIKRWVFDLTAQRTTPTVAPTAKKRKRLPTCSRHRHKHCRTVLPRCTKKRRHHCRRKPKRHIRLPAPPPGETYTLIRNPPNCAGGNWAIRLRIGYSNGQQVREAKAPCSG